MIWCCKFQYLHFFQEVWHLFYSSWVLLLKTMKDIALHHHWTCHINLGDNTGTTHEMIYDSMPVDSRGWIGSVFDFSHAGSENCNSIHETKGRQWSRQQQHSLGALLTLPSWHRGKRASACGQWDCVHRDAKIPPACQVKRCSKEKKKTEYVNKVGLTEARLKGLFVWKMVDAWLTVAF